MKPDLQNDGISWNLIDKKPIPDNLKMFSTAKEGWLAYAINGILFVKQFPDTKPESYSPEQGEVEIYINKEKSYIELENQGEYKLLKPWKSLTYKETWFLALIPETIKVEIGNQKLAEIVRQKMKFYSQSKY